MIGVGLGLGFSQPAPYTPSGILFSDSFNRPDADTLGAQWSIFSGGWGIRDNAALIIDTPDYDQIAYRDVGTPNAQVTSIIRRNNADASILSRYNPDSRDNFYQWGIDGNLYRNVSGAWHMLGSFSPPSTGDWATLSISLSGDLIEAYYNRSKVITVNDAELIGNTVFGIRNGSPTSGIWDSFEVRSVQPAPMTLMSMTAADYINVPLIGTGAYHDPIRPDTSASHWQRVAEDGDSLTIEILNGP